MEVFSPSRETGLYWGGPGPHGAVPLPHHHSAKLFPEAPGGAQGTKDPTCCYCTSQHSSIFQAVPYS